MSKSGIPNPPVATEPRNDWEHYDLFESVKKAIYSLPSRFESTLNIDGVLATDLFAFNSSLGATIEQQVVDSLNKLRSVWDPEHHYELYEFERQPQTFPDVVLKASAPDVEPTVLMGIELKGWYVLAKEKEPSFRYKVTPLVCAPADLLVVVPWALSNVISGSPMVFEPFVMGARHAAEYRNWYWRHKKKGTSNKNIELSSADQFYPNKSDKISDHPVSDSGGNYGRLARTGVMDEYIAELFEEKLSGIQLASWQQFLALFTEGATNSDVDIALQKIAKNVAASVDDPEASKKLAEKFREIAGIIEGE
ncbi:MAG TPA: hypothetical protein VFN01_03680 [Marinobacter sp.]|uniref:hypothetical protein n=1 Tax=Marinobacter sp. TaxID=50741 RepID=UPI002D7F26FB|nr:hypothetical protein [Marinobacter sp.]HET8800264.1 hypothetical protein [Marinobacter sp.]